MPNKNILMQQGSSGQAAGNIWTDFSIYPPSGGYPATVENLEIEDNTIGFTSFSYYQGGSSWPSYFLLDDPLTVLSANFTSARECQTGICLPYLLQNSQIPWGGVPIVIGASSPPPAANKARFNNVFTIYPVPANQNLNMDYIYAQQFAEMHISILDMTGRELKTQEIIAQQGTISIPVNDIPAGIYIYQVLADGKNVSRGSFTIVH